MQREEQKVTGRPFVSHIPAPSKVFIVKINLK